MNRTILQLFRYLSTLAIGLCVLSQPVAADYSSLAGKWKWSWSGQDGEKRESTMILKEKEGKISGAVISGQLGEAPISDFKLEGDQVTFKVVRERDGNTFTISYKGTLKGDNIKGQIQVGDNSRDWDAKKEKADPISGLWKWTFNYDDRVINSSAKLKLDGEKVTGKSIRSNGDEVEISEGKFKDGKLTFVVNRERDGTKIVVNYQGKVENDVITGKMVAKWDGDEREVDWNAKRSKE